MSCHVMSYHLEERKAGTGSDTRVWIPPEGRLNGRVVPSTGGEKGGGTHDRLVDARFHWVGGKESTRQSDMQDSRLGLSRFLTGVQSLLSLLVAILLYRMTISLSFYDSSVLSSLSSRDHFRRFSWKYADELARVNLVWNTSWPADCV
jgi:hypothetical protein